METGGNLMDGLHGETPPTDQNKLDDHQPPAGQVQPPAAPQAKAPRRKRQSLIERLDALVENWEEPSQPPHPMTHASAIKDLAERAHQGDEEARAQLRALLDNSPELLQHVGRLNAE